MMPPFSRRSLSPQKAKKILSLRWIVRLLVFVFALVFLGGILFFWRIFFGPLGEFTRSFPTFWNFSALILLQNEAELRPSGGFVSGFFLLEISGGIPHFSFFDSYAVLDPAVKKPAPVALESIFSADKNFPGWTFRDANFSPDFRVSAESMLSFLQEDPRFSEKTIDAVIAVNFSAVKKVVEVFFGEESAESLFLEMQRSSKNIDLHEKKALSERKSTIDELQKMLQREVGILDLPRLFALVAEEAEQKNIQMFFRNTALQQKAEQKNWAGALPKEEFWGIFFANLGARKSDSVLQKIFFSEIRLQENAKAREHLTILLPPGGEENILVGPGWYFVQIFRPQGTAVLEESLPRAFAQRDLPQGTEFSFLLPVSPEKGAKIDLNFLLPRLPQKIWWHPQSGTRPHLFFSVTGPGETQFFASECTGGERLFCSRALDHEYVISPRVVADTFPPFLEQIFLTNEREIFLRFSERIQAKADIANFALECQEKEVPLTNIVFSEEQKRDATLVLGAPLQHEESFCLLRWKGIVDLLDNEGSGKITLPRRDPQSET